MRWPWDGRRRTPAAPDADWAVRVAHEERERVRRLVDRVFPPVSVTIEALTAPEGEGPRWTASATLPPTSPD